MKKITSAILLAAFAVSVCSCGDAGISDTSDTVNNTPAVTSAAKTNGEVAREDTPDSLPANLNFKGVTLNVLFPESYGGTADQIDWVTEDDGDVINSAVYNRQLAVEDRLNVKFNIISDQTVDQWKNILVSSVLAGDKSYDIVYGAQAVMATLITEGVYNDLSGAKYLDFDQPWWNNRFMDELTIDGSRYMLAGDISLSMLSYMSCMYFNKNQFETVTGENSDDLYKTVLDGNWTMDKLAEYCRLCYHDLNGDSASDINDQFGLGVICGSFTDHMVFDSGITFTTRDKNNIPELTLNNDRTMTFVEKLYSLFYKNEGVYVFPQTQDSLRITIPNKLINGEITFMCAYFYSANLLRDMKSDYGIIPYPKLDDKIDGYSSLVHDAAMLVSVPITCDKMDAVCAALEATAAENYRTVTPAYYEVALKTKYIRDDMSGQIIDMIRDAGMTDFTYVYNYSMNKIGTIMRTLMSNKTSDFASTYASILPAAQSGLDALIEKLTSKEKSNS